MSKTVGMVRALPIYYARYGSTVESLFIEASRLENKLQRKLRDLPTDAIGLYAHNQIAKEVSDATLLMLLRHSLHHDN